MLKSIYQKADEATMQKTFASVQQSLATMNTHTNQSLNPRVDHPDNHERAERPEEVNLEEISIHFLRAYSIHPNWKQIISSCNDYGQTIAHISITLGYLRLLRHLSTWGIDLNVVDNMGLTALHYAYLFKQEECARFLIHSGVDQFILDDLGRSPSDLDPSLGARLRSDTDIDSDNYAEGASPIEYDNEMPDETGKLFAKHFLVQQWMRQGEDERRGEVPPSRCQSPETLGPPRSAGSPVTLDSADELDSGVAYDHSSSLGVRIPEENSTLIVAEEVHSGLPIEIVVSPHNTLPPSPISEFSAQIQDANRPSEIGQKPFSHQAPLGGTANTLDFERPQIYHGTRALHHFEPCRPSGVSTAMHAALPQGTSEDVEEQNGAKTPAVAVTGEVQSASFNPQPVAKGRHVGNRAHNSHYNRISIDEGTGTVSLAASGQGQYCIIIAGAF